MGVRAIIATCCAVLSVALSTVPAQAAFPGQNGKFVFRTGNDALYTRNSDGSGLSTIPSSAGLEAPAWSPDGQRIAAYSIFYDDVIIMDADGSNVTPMQLYPSGRIDIAWSPDASELAVGVVICSGEACSSEAELIFRVPTDGSGSYTHILTTPGGSEAVDWSPDGTKIAFVKNNHTALMNPDGTGQTETTVAGFQPDWSPDGSRIAVSSSSGIRTIKPDGTGSVPVTSNSNDNDPIWSPDGTRIAFFRASNLWTAAAGGGDEQQLTNDGFGGFNLDWQAIPINSYPRPKGATPTQVALVPAYAQCTSPNRTHGPPLAFPSCALPAQTSDELTVGTADSNGKAAKARGLVRYDVLPGAPATPADEADVQIRVELSDVYEQGTLTDYAGELRSRTSLRITDKLNTPHPGGSGAATVSDATLGATVPCTATADTTEGASCNLVTTFDALVLGTVTETKRSIWALGAAQLDDGGADNDADTPGDNTLFMTQGIFIP